MPGARPVAPAGSRISTPRNARRRLFLQVFLAKKWDTNLPECAVLLLEGQNVKLADAYNWLANAENSLGKAAEAEARRPLAWSSCSRPRRQSSGRLLSPPPL